MHIPDGFIDLPVSVGAAVVAATGVGVALRRAGADSTEAFEARIPLTGLVAAFIFAAQMLNFPVAGGTSGHVMGAMLAAVLVGPWLGTLAVTVVLIVQCLLFADGGVSALGLNVIDMALVPTVVGYGLFMAIRWALPASRRAILVATAVGSLMSVVAASLAFCVEYALGGNGVASFTTVASAMVGVHVLIGLGEAVITTLTVSLVLASRPDLVQGARDLPVTIAPEMVAV